ncbi:MAG: metal-dependent hydrolase [Planctomycetaceae bacterium]|nr:metal-dependent hydrolase [Planctomycetaceae bacterium]
MKLHFLGTGGYHPNERRHTACLMVPEVGLVFDAGTAAFRIPGLLQTDELTICLSHAHLDHICGLTYLLVPLLDGRLKQARLFARQAVLDAVRNHLFAEPVFPLLPENLLFLPLEETTQIDVGPDLSVTHHPLVSHPGGSNAFRLEWHRGSKTLSLAYVTDTTVDGSYDDFIQGAQLLVHECYFSDEQIELAQRTGHSCVSMVTQLAQRVGAGQLVLVHMDPTRTDNNPVNITQARKHFRNVCLAEDQTHIDLKSLPTVC